MLTRFHHCVPFGFQMGREHTGQGPAKMLKAREKEHSVVGDAFFPTH